MPRIYYTANGYSGNYRNINTQNEEFILCRKIDLYRSMITVGNPSYLNLKDIRQYGLWRALSNSIIQKILLVQINIESNPNGIHLHNIYRNYISDKKREVSYNLGMAVAKLYAERLLNISNLIHVESLKKTNAITFINQVGRTKEPDLVGQTNDGLWHVFEAKGTSSSYLNKPINEAKHQARQIDRIHGQPPTTISACATSFGFERIFSRIEDPISQGKKEIEINTDKFYENYYLPLFALDESTSSKLNIFKVDNLEFNGLNIYTDKLNLTVGIDAELYQYLREKNLKKVQEYNLNEKKFSQDFLYENQISIGSDGFIVKYANH